MTTDPDTGVAGRTNYSKWDRVTSDLVQDAEAEEAQEVKENAKALGLDGKYARSQAEADERKKAQDALKTKKRIDTYQQRQDSVMQSLAGLLLECPPKHDKDNDAPKATTSEQRQIVRVTREMMDAGKRVVTVSDTSGKSQKDMIVLTQDLNHLESAMPANTIQQPKQYKDDAENSVPNEQTRKVFGLIKLFLTNVHNCTIVLRCKLISGMVEMSHCSNVTLRVEKEATVPTLQVDLCQDINIEYHDSPSGKHSPTPSNNVMYWGEDKDDRIFHAGVSNMKISLWRDGFVDMETTADYEKDGATAVGNASAKEFQFVTSVVNGDLVTENVLREGATTGNNVRAMTQREADAEKIKREKAAAMAIEMAENSIRFVEKNKDSKVSQTPKPQENDAEVAEEIYTSMSKQEIDSIVKECERNKARGNEAFGSGEYAQAVLLYTLALDKAEELPDLQNTGPPLFPRHIVLSNRSASFLKLGHHEKALADATRAVEIDPTYVKAVFRKGLALHAMGKYEEAMPVLAKAQQLEPKNKQVAQALQFCEVRLTQQMRERMQG